MSYGGFDPLDTCDPYEAIDEGEMRWIERAYPIAVYLWFKFLVISFVFFYEGLTHHHRSIVATQKELDAVPKVRVESSRKQQDDIFSTESRCELIFSVVWILAGVLFWGLVVSERKITSGTGYDFHREKKLECKFGKW